MINLLIRSDLRKIFSYLSISVLLSLLWFKCFALNSIKATEENANNSNSLMTVTLKLDKEFYEFNDDAEAQIILKNISKKDIYIYSKIEWGEGSSISLWVKDFSTKENIEEIFIADEQSIPPQSKSDFTKISSSKNIISKFKFSLRDFKVQPGKKYEIIAEYHSPVPAAMSFGLPIWSSEMGSVSSTPLVIKIN